MHQTTTRVFGGFRGVILRLDWAAAERQWLMLLIGVAGTGRGMGLTGVFGEVSSRRTRVDIVGCGCFCCGHFLGCLVSN